MTTTTTTSTTNANDDRSTLVAEAKKALASVVDGRRKLDSGTARLAIAFYTALQHEYIDAPERNWNKVNAMIPEAAAFIGIVVKGKDKATNAEIQAIRRAWPIAAYLIDAKASVAIKVGANERRINGAGEFFLDPATVDNSTDNEDEAGYCERSAGSVLNAARTYFGGNTASTRATKIKAALDALIVQFSGSEKTGLMTAVEFPADAWEGAQNVLGHLQRLIDERAAAQNKNNRKVA